MRMPGTSYQLPLPPLSAEETVLPLRAHVVKLAGEIGERNMFHYSHLQHAADYIRVCAGLARVTEELAHR